jgi:hypothetical protein
MAAPRLVHAGPVPGLKAAPGEPQDDGSAQRLAHAAPAGLSASGATAGGPGVPGRAGVRSWPLMLLALPAAVAVWSGWVGIGQLTGFGQVHPLPGIWSSLHIDSAVTVPVGVEAYAAYALHAWLVGGDDGRGLPAGADARHGGRAGAHDPRRRTRGARGGHSRWDTPRGVRDGSGLRDWCRPSGRGADCRREAGAEGTAGVPAKLAAAGVRGSNAELGVLARLTATSAGQAPPGPR